MVKLQFNRNITVKVPVKQFITTIAYELLPKQSNGKVVRAVTSHDSQRTRHWDEHCIYWVQELNTCSKGSTSKYAWLESEGSRDLVWSRWPGNLNDSVWLAETYLNWLTTAWIFEKMVRGLLFQLMYRHRSKAKIPANPIMSRWGFHVCVMPATEGLMWPR